MKTATNNQRERERVFGDLLESLNQAGVLGLLDGSFGADDRETISRPLLPLAMAFREELRRFLQDECWRCGQRLFVVGTPLTGEAWCPEDASHFSKSWRDVSESVAGENARDASFDLE